MESCTHSDTPWAGRERGCHPWGFPFSFSRFVIFTNLGLGYGDLGLGYEDLGLGCDDLGPGYEDLGLRYEDLEL